MTPGLDTRPNIFIYISPYIDMPQTIHMPRLDTVLMVEETIRKLDYYPTRNQLWRALPKMVMWQTLGVIPEYLEESNKILVTKDRKIMWIFADTPKSRKLLKTAIPYRKAYKT